MNRSAQSDDLVALTQLASLQPDPRKFESWLRQQLSTRSSVDGVTLASVHRVKGQEWPVVVLHHAEADQYPHRLADDLEEERRGFHVAITRCSESLVIVAGAKPSTFIDEMRREPPEFVAASPTPAAAVARSKKPVRDSAFEKDVVLAAIGLTLVDGGQEWRIEALEGDAVVTRL